MTDSVHSANAETRSVHGHTPGAWWVAESGVRDKGGYIAFSLTTTHWPDQDERYAKEVLERKANMRLIAAAPELKEQLATMTALLRIKCGNLEPDVFAEILKSEAVLAKATGATP